MRPVKVGLDRAAASWSPEVKYVLRTLLRIAGLPCEFVWADDATGQAPPLDLYYGARPQAFPSTVAIAASELDFSKVHERQPVALTSGDGLDFLEFHERAGAPVSRIGDGLQFRNDIVYTCFWLLTGASEPGYRRDRWDNLHLDGSFFLRHDLASRPLVSLYGARLRDHFRGRGHQPLEPAWGPGAAFVFTHDVDYPEIIRWIECLRLLVTRGWKARASAAGVLRGTNHFWKFADWVEFEKVLGVRPAFYFMARRGSLVRYALGNPDAFYDIHGARFRDLFHYLRDEGCEIGLHASFEAWRSADRLIAERQTLEQAAGVAVEGNRHHYWHLNPTDPNETLLLHEQARLLYDSSLGFEYYPGFRRGICHPFRVFHPGRRRELDVVQLPPAWMDDHFDRRLHQNRITDPDQYAHSLVQAAERTHGTIVVDYHQRGMNADFYPRYGPWLRHFLEEHADGSLTFLMPSDVVGLYRELEQRLAASSVDQTEPALNAICSGGE